MAMNTYISYSAPDRDIALEVGRVLADLGIPHFLDPHDISWGDKLSDTIQNALSSSSTFLFVVSPASLKSERVAYEVGFALALGKTVLPFLIHPDLKMPVYFSHLRFVTTVDEIKAHFRQVLTDADGPRQCFLVAPIGPKGSEVRHRSDAMLRHVIGPALAETGYEVTRADEISAPGVVTNQIIQHVIESPLVIADLSGLNPNVMYELAIRHSVRKPVIQIIHEGHSIPFDVHGLRTLIVDLADLESVVVGRQNLTRMVLEIDADPSVAESPVTTALLAATLTSSTTLRRPKMDASEAVINAMKDIDQRLQGLEYAIRKQPKPEDDERETFSRRVFIVHGHDGELKNELARLLERLDFEPVILHEQADRGQTIFSKLRGEMADVGFAFVLLTPDDLGTLAKNPENLKPRGRQNVVFEHGLFVGHLEPSRVCAICKGDIELPSDLHGVLYKPLPQGGTLNSIALDLVQELRAAGYDVDANKL